MNKSKIVIIIAGQTASGKTDVSLQLAEHYNTSIISADSRQCFKELNIGVAKPNEDALRSIKHYFINSHSIHDKVNAEVFEQFALKATEEIFAGKDIAIMVGGTGMYIKVFCEGLDIIPEVDISVHSAIVNNYRLYGLEWLQNEVQKRDPEFWLKAAEQKNPQRLMRALEIKIFTGKSINYFRLNKKQERNFKIIKFALQISKEKLHNNINDRVDKMIKSGLINEASALQQFQHINALQTVGYKEIFEFLDAKYSKEIAIEKIKLHTRQYAKRQLTWFKKQDDYIWTDVELSSLIKLINQLAG